MRRILWNACPQLLGLAQLPANVRMALLIVEIRSWPTFPVIFQLILQKCKIHTGFFTVFFCSLRLNTAKGQVSWVNIQTWNVLFASIFVKKHPKNFEFDLILKTVTCEHCKLFFSMKLDQIQGASSKSVSWLKGLDL